MESRSNFQMKTFLLFHFLDDDRLKQHFLGELMDV